MKKAQEEKKMAEREIMQEELSTLRSTVKAMQDMMTQQGFFEDEMNKQ